MVITLKNIASIPAKELSNDVKLQIMQMFSYPFKGEEYVSTCNYLKGTLEVPPNIPKLQTISEMLGYRIVDKRTNGNDPEEPFVQSEQFTFRQGQEEPSRNFLEYIKQNQYGTLLAPCGSGKSLMTAYCAGHLQRKILILLDQKNLIDNWEKSFEIVWNKKVQIVRGKDTKFGDVCVVTYQLLNHNKNLLKRICNEFGTLVLEEAHSCPCKSFLNVISNLNNFYRLSCTATFYRKTLPTEVLEDYCGPVAVTVENAERLIPKVYFVNTGIKLTSNDPDQFSSIVSDLASNELRNEQILKMVKRGIDKNRKIIVICSRIEQANWLHERARKFCNSVSYHSKTPRWVEQSLKVNFEEGRLDVLFSVGKAKKGMDLQNLDVCINTHLSNNKGDLQQITGRILRKWDGKPQPVILDLVDEGSLAFSFAKNHRRWYREFGYEFAEN